MSLPSVNIGGLDCLEIPGDPNLGTVVVLHGYGATHHDLAPLSRVFTGPRWLFPNAPLKIEFGPDYTGYGWFPVDVMAIREATAKKQLDKVEMSFSPDLDHATDQLIAFLKELQVPYNKLVLGGFSQGAICCVDCALKMSDQIAGLMLLSPTLTHAAQWKERCAQHKGLPFFMSHGTHDDVLPLELTQRLEKLLLEGGLKGRLHTFTGGHEVPFSLLLELQPFFKSILKPAH